MVKKVVALETCGILRITEGKVYEVLEESKEFYFIRNNYKACSAVWKKRFKPLEEEMEIKVGSEWVGVKNNHLYEVTAVGKRYALFLNYTDGTEYPVEFNNIKNALKPKPTRRTVWLNVYPNRIFSHLSKTVADANKMADILYQQEVELIDPREGERHE